MSRPIYLNPPRQRTRDPFTGLRTTTWVAWALAATLFVVAFTLQGRLDRERALYRTVATVAAERDVAARTCEAQHE